MRNPETVEKTVEKTEEKPGDKLKEKTREKILEILLTNNRITIPELANMVNITYKGVQYHLTEMKKEGMIIREGSRKTGYWKIIQENEL